MARKVPIRAFVQAAMSAWYITSALGFYAVDPVSRTMCSGPLFDRAAIALGNGKTLVIQAEGNAPDEPYVQSVTSDRNPYTKSWFSHAQIAQGGKIVLRMGAQPNEKLGAAVEAAVVCEVRRAGRLVRASWVGVPRAGAGAGFPFRIPDLWHPEAATRNGH
jgi:hypothetical protein